MSATTALVLFALLGCVSSTVTEAPIQPGLQNAGMNCWNACHATSGPCPHYCGAKGLCCRQDWNDGENGCALQQGEDGYHGCVAMARCVNQTTQNHLETAKCHRYDKDMTTIALGLVLENLYPHHIDSICRNSCEQSWQPQRAEISTCLANLTDSGETLTGDEKQLDFEMVTMNKMCLINDNNQYCVIHWLDAHAKWDLSCERLAKWGCCGRDLNDFLKAAVATGQTFGSMGPTDLETVKALLDEQLVACGMSNTSGCTKVSSGHLYPDHQPAVAKQSIAAGTVVGILLTIFAVGALVGWGVWRFKNRTLMANVKVIRNEARQSAFVPLDEDTSGEQDFDRV